METKTLHFTIGADMGRTLMQIAYEHFTHSHNLTKALRTLELGEGCDTKMQVQILTGSKIILVDEESQEFIVADRIHYPELDAIYPKIELDAYADKFLKEMNTRGDEILEALRGLSRRFADWSTYRMNFSIEATLKFIHGDDGDMIAELEDDYELNQWRAVIEIALGFVKLGMQKADDIRKLAGILGYDLNLNTVKVIEIAEALQAIARGDFQARFVNVGGVAVPSVTDYIKSVHEIDEVISKGIEPVDIMEKWSAGWLSPEGNYYALNGEIANMLHVQIADALQEIKIIPSEDELDMETPDSWLEQNGWVRIHENNIQFAGCLNHKINKKNVNLTKKQIEVIRDYITNCHACRIKVGWRREDASIGMFIALAMKDPLALNKKYFDFD